MLQLGLSNVCTTGIVACNYIVLPLALMLNLVDALYVYMYVCTCVRVCVYVCEYVCVSYCVRACTHICALSDAYVSQLEFAFERPLLENRTNLSLENLPGGSPRQQLLRYYNISKVRDLESC